MNKLTRRAIEAKIEHSDWQAAAVDMCDEKEGADDAFYDQCCDAISEAEDIIAVWLNHTDKLIAGLEDIPAILKWHAEDEGGLHVS